MGTIAEKLTYLSDTKVAIHDAIQAQGVTITAGTPFRNYATKISEIEGSGTGGTTPEPDPVYERPTSWLPLPSTVGQDKISMLVAVFETDTEILSFRTKGNLTIDWGDGTVEANPNQYYVDWNIEHQYDFNDPNLDSSTLAEFGYKQAIVTITGTAPVGEEYKGIQKLDLGQRPVSIPTLPFYAYFSYNVLDVEINCPYLIVLVFRGYYSMCTYLENVNILSCGVSSFNEMFMDLENIKNVKLVIPQASTLNNCFKSSSIVWVDIEISNTLTHTNYMFTECESFKYFYITGDTSSITNMERMFNYCSSLETVPLFDTSSVTNMFYMFSSCSSLETVPLFDTSSVTNMERIFNSCSSLETVPLFDTSSVTNMGYMFSNCSSLETVPLFDTSSVTNMNNMFSGCLSLKTVPLFDTSSVTNMSTMFSSCKNLKTVPLFDTSSVTNMFYMFSYCSSLETVPSFDTSSAIDMSGIFNYCKNLKTVSDLNIPLATSITRMFSYCLSLVKVGIIDAPKATNLSYLFNYCGSLAEVPVINAALADNCYGMFYSAKPQIINAIDIPVVTNSTNFFYKNYSIREVKMSISFTADLTNNLLSGPALDRMYTLLPTVTGKTLTVTGNYGTATHDTSIATAKGWTIVE